MSNHVRTWLFGNRPEFISRTSQRSRDTDNWSEMTNYADTERGALQYLAADSDLRLEEAQAEADPVVPGVRKITTPSDPFIEFVIV